MKLNRIFSSHMVFAADKPIRIYGEGRGNAEISFAGTTKTVMSDSERWMVEFPPMEYGGPYQLKAVFEDEKIILDDIYVGEVYLFAGQSNMQFKLKESVTSKSFYETNEKLRLFSTERIEKTDYYTPKDGWVKADKDEIENWSAIAYLASNEISKSKGIAVGAVVCYQGASVIESWVPCGAFEKLGVASDKRHSDHFNEYYRPWNKDGALYSFALSQVVPFSVSAVVWYQGESDTAEEEGKVYAEELSTLISIWRKDFCNSSLPFVVIQIADFDLRRDEAWRLVQKAQLDVQSLQSHVKTVISADVCETDDIHPKTKHKLAHKIAQALVEL